MYWTLVVVNFVTVVSYVSRSINLSVYLCCKECNSNKPFCKKKKKKKKAFNMKLESKYTRTYVKTTAESLSITFVLNGLNKSFLHRESIELPTK